jgi:uncharacterized protein (TIGR02118 family)
MYKMMVLLRRKRNMSMRDFIEYYERQHAPMASEWLPEIREYRRNYELGTGPRSNDPSANFDVVTEMYFDSAGAAEGMYERLQTDPELARRFREDEAQLFDISSLTTLALDERVSALPVG